MMGPMTSQAPPFSIPVRYMLAGMAAFLLFAVDLVIQSFQLGPGTAGMPSIVALTHLLTLGVLLSFVMGAVYQLLTVAFLTPIRVVAVARYNFWVYLVSIVGLWLSMQQWNIIGLIVFASLAALSVYAYCVLILVSLHYSKVMGAMRGFVQAAHVYLMLAVTVAWLIVLSQFSHIWMNLQLQLLATHIVLAVSFFTFLIMGFTFKLLPMFSLAHGFSTARQKYTLMSLHAAVWLILTGIWVRGNVGFGITIVGSIFAITAFTLQCIDIRAIMKTRMRKKTEFPLRLVVAAAVLCASSSIIILGLLISRATFVQWQNLVTFYLLAWIVLTVMSYAYKIIPFLIWSERYGSKVGKIKTKMPLMKDLLNLQHSRYVYAGYLSGITLLILSVEFNFRAGIVMGAVLFAVSVIVFAVQMFYVMDLPLLKKELLAKPGADAPKTLEDTNRRGSAE